MRPASRSILLGGLIGVAVLFACLVAMTRAGDGEAFHEALVDLRQLTVLGAQIDKEALSVRYGRSQNYGVLMRLVDETRAVVGSLRRATARLKGDANIARNIDHAAQSVEEEAAAVEEFKSANALLANAIAFLPIAASNATAAAPNSLVLERQVSDLARACLFYDLSPSVGHKADVLAGMGRLASLSNELDETARDAASVLIVHVRTILLEHERTNALLAVVMAPRRRLAYDRFYDFINDDREHLLERGNWYRLVVLLFSVVVLSGLIRMFLRTRRDAAVLERALAALETDKRAVEREWEAVARLNEDLEQRVAERTDAVRQANALLKAKLRELTETRRNLAEASRKAGMADVASTVLHNVGNVLNSVNVSAGLLIDTMRSSKTSSVAKLSELFREHREDLATFLVEDKRGRLLPDYIARLNEAIEAERMFSLNEACALRKNIDHINVIIAAQQSNARAGGVSEKLSIAALLDEAVACQVASYEKHGVALVREYANLPDLVVDRHKLFQVIVNLLANARQAMSECEVKRIVLRTMHLGDRISVEVADTGCGIAPENLQRVFNYGFTTKRDGHGFGLHGSACAATEMGWRLSAHSDGPNRGACFRLEMPLAAVS